jgi:hypothetical protein
MCGSLMLPHLRHDLAAQRAGTGDSLLMRVVDGEAGVYQVRLESHQQRNDLAVDREDYAGQGAANELRGMRQRVWTNACATTASFAAS